MKLKNNLNFILKAFSRKRKGYKDGNIKVILEISIMWIIVRPFWVVSRSTQSELVGRKIFEEVSGKKIRLQPHFYGEVTTQKKPF